MALKKIVFLASDHAGYPLKQSLLEALVKHFSESEFKDLGAFNQESTDYPVFAQKLAQAVVREKGRGILVCGSGIGMSISANKTIGARAAVAWDVTSARLSRQHNDANILCLGARLIGPDTALEAARTWLSTEFEGGRHQRRVDLISQLEERA